MAARVNEFQVVGAGPAGLMAAEVLASSGAKVTIIDHHTSPARKFLLAGRGGLNLTHSEALERFLVRYGEARDFLEPAIRAFPPDAVRQWCEGLGVKTFVGSSGRVFPACMKASPVLRAWLRRLAGLGVTLRSNTKWQGFDDTPTILAMGGASWPELGSDGGWAEIFEKAGIAVAALEPSNSRQRVAWSEDFATKFAGSPVKNIAVTANGTSVLGEIMIAPDGLEGGAVYALSGQLRNSRSMLIDLKPTLSEAEVESRLVARRSKDSRSTFLRKAFNLPPVAIALMRETGSSNPKQVVVNTSGPADIRRAISTAGGVARDEVDGFFRLKKKPNTWVVGEMLDWDAPTGGYLLQACFSTTHWAATDCLKWLAERK